MKKRKQMAMHLSLSLGTGLPLLPVCFIGQTKAHGQFRLKVEGHLLCVTVWKLWSHIANEMKLRMREVVYSFFYLPQEGEFK
jgi:hypothetical protein